MTAKSAIRAPLVAVAAAVVITCFLVSFSAAQSIGNWGKEAAQGYTEYSSQNSSGWIAVSCDVAATMDGGGTGISLEIGGALPPANSTLTFSVDGEAIAIPSDRSGGISMYQCPDCEQHLHKLLAGMLGGRRLDIQTSDGRRASFPLDGLAALMTEPCRTPGSSFSPRQSIAPVSPDAAPMALGSTEDTWAVESGSGNAVATGRADDGTTLLSLACGQASQGRVNATLAGYEGSALAEAPGAAADLTFYFVRADRQFTHLSGRAMFIEATRSWIVRELPPETFDELLQSNELMIGNADGVGVAKFTIAGSVSLWNRMRETCSPASRDGGNVVAQVQERLNQLGYDAGTVDGAMGQRTRAAIIAFQKAYGLPITGMADRSLLDAIESAAHSAASAVAPALVTGTGAQIVTQDRPGDVAPSMDVQALLAKSADLRCDNRPDPTAYASGRDFGYLGEDSSERYMVYSESSDLIRIGGEQTRFIHLAGTGDDVIYVDRSDTGVQVLGENGGDTIIVCGVGTITPSIELGPWDGAPDLAIIDIQAFLTAPPQGASIAVSGLNPANDRLIIRSPPGTEVSFASSVITVGNVSFYVTEGSPPFFRATSEFDPRTITVTSGSSVLHPPSDFHRFAGQPIGAPSQTIRVDGARAITLAGTEAPPLPAGLACSDSAAIMQPARPVDERFERTGGGRSLVFPNTSDAIIFRDDELWQFLMAGSGDDRVYLFGAAPGSHVEGGPGADHVVLCDFAADDMSVLVATGTSDSSPDADGDIVVLDPSTFAGTNEGSPRRIYVSGFEPTTDRLVLIVPDGLDVGYSNHTDFGLVISAGAAVIEVTNSLSLGMIDPASVTLVPESALAAMAPAAGADNSNEGGIRRWSYGPARTLGGHDAVTFEPDPDCQDVSDPDTRLIFTDPSFVPTGAEYQPDQTYTRGDDLIRLDGVQDWLYVHAGPGDDSIFLSDIGSDLDVNGNSGSDLIVLCSMRGLAVTLQPGSRSVDIDADTLLIDAATFRDVPAGMRRTIVINGLNPVNDRLIVRVPADLVVEAPRSPNGSIQAISAGAVTIQASSSIFFDHLHVADAVTIVPATEE